MIQFTNLEAFFIFFIFYFFAMKIIGTETKIGDSKAWMDLLSLSFSHLVLLALFAIVMGLYQLMIFATLMA